jgi:hypothetical protein
METAAHQSLIYALVAAGAVVILNCIALYVIKKWLNSVGDRMDAVASKLEMLTERLSACELENSKTYATWEQHNRLDKKVDEIDTRVVRLEERR